jgi:hypothetical protein
MYIMVYEKLGEMARVWDGDPLCTHRPMPVVAYVVSVTACSTSMGLWPQGQIAQDYCPSKWEVGGMVTDYSLFLEMVIYIRGA